MAEKIGNAITDEKNTVELLSAKTALVSSEGNSDKAVFSGTISSGDRILMCLNGNLYKISVATSVGNPIDIELMTLPTE